jgi:hypothetical protein
MVAMLKKPYVEKLARLLITILICGVAFGLLLQPAGITKLNQSGETRLPIQFRQLEPPWEKLATLRCGDAILTTPKDIKDLSCVLTNNSSKDIVAGTLSISITLDKPGELASYLTFDSFLNSDFRARHPNNLLAAGDDFEIRDSQTTLDYPIVTIRAFIDYLEFSDGTTAGPNRAGSRILAGQREGARKYKEWMVSKYQIRQSLQPIIPLLTQRGLPSGFAVTTSDEEQGAQMYRGEMRRIYEAEGPEGLAKLLGAQRKN